jgi:hypothetical protein
MPPVTTTSVAASVSHQRGLGGEVVRRDTSNSACLLAMIGATYNQAYLCGGVCGLERGRLVWL